MKHYIKKLLRFLKIFLIFFFLFSIFTVILYRFLPPPVTPLMIIRLFEQVWDGKSMKLKKEWVPMEKISPNLVRAVMASEDQKFPQHFGFDWEAMRKAFEHNMRKHKGNKIHGGSTITQQVAKNVFLWPARSFIRKVFEAYFTLLIEIFWSKDRIMEVYLNVIEMGDGVYGAEAASRSYYHHAAGRLSRDEAAGIAAILPNPRKYSPVRHSGFVAARKPKILHDMNYMNPKFD